jgi:hypothetical protein
VLAVRPRLPRGLFYLCWLITPLMFFAAAMTYFTEDASLLRALATAGAGVGGSVFFHLLLYGVMRLAKRHDPRIELAADGVITLFTPMGEVKSWRRGQVKGFEVSTDSGSTRVELSLADGGNAQILYPGTFPRHRLARVERWLRSSAS